MLAIMNTIIEELKAGKSYCCTKCLFVNIMMIVYNFAHYGFVNGMICMS